MFNWRLFSPCVRILVALCCSELMMLSAWGGYGVTDSLQKRIDDASAAGGGTVTLSAGEYPVAGLFLKSNVTLELKKGAVLVASTNRSDYSSVVAQTTGRSSGHNAVLGANAATNIALVGEGVVDGRGWALHPMDREPGRWRDLLFYRCRGVRVEGVTLRNPATWTFYVKECENVVIRRVTIRALQNMNNDGIDIDAKNVLIEDCDIDADDDAICPKSDNSDFICENVEVRNCRLASNCNHIKLGTSSRGGFRNIWVHDCELVSCATNIIPQFKNKIGKSNDIPGWDKRDIASRVGIAIECVDGGILENVRVSDIRMTRCCQTPILVRLGRRREHPRGLASHLKDVVIENVTGESASLLASSITGVPGLRPQNITIRNVKLRVMGGGPASEVTRPVPEVEKAYPENRMFRRQMLPAYGFYVRHADGVRFENVELTYTGDTEARPAILTDDSTGVETVDCRLQKPQGDYPTVLRAMTTGSATPVVVLPESPSSVERSAAKELAEGLGRVLGATIATVSEKESTADSVNFYVGATKALEAIHAGRSWKTDEVLLKSVPGGVVLAGDPARAPLYAVDLYLEKYCGVRWWTSTEADYPRLGKVPAENVDHAFVPPFAYRETYYLDGFDPTFKVRSKGNFSSLTRFMFTDMAFIPPEKGGNHRLYFFEGRHSAYHSFFEILAPSNHFKAHPDWFSLVKGTRVPKQLCLSNAEMKKAYIAETLRRLREDSSVDFIQVSQNDRDGACECAACKALEAEDGGVSSGPYLRFANEVAEAVEREFPNVRVDTFAYQFTRKAPTKTRPRHNVVVRLCDIECDFSTPLAEGRHARNAAFVKDLQAWSRVASGRLFIWDYLANFTSYMMPHPNIGSIAPNIRLFLENGATGIFEQGDALCSAGTFVALRHYLTSHLLWNPAADEKKLIDEFLRGYYGKAAAPHLKAYLDLVESAPRQKGMFVGCYHKTADFLTADEALDAAALMRKAVRAARKDGEVFARRVRREELSVDHLFILCWDAYRAAAEKRHLRWDRPATRQEAIEKWAADCAAYGVLAYRETVKRELFPEYLKSLRAVPR